MKSKTGISHAEIESIKQKVIDLISNSPSKAVTVLTGWIAASEKPRKAAPTAQTQTVRVKKVG